MELRFEDSKNSLLTPSIYKVDTVLAGYEIPTDELVKFPIKLLFSRDFYDTIITSKRLHFPPEKVSTGAEGTWGQKDQHDPRLFGEKSCV